MAEMIPRLDEAQLSGLRSRAEAKVYRACRDQLPTDWIVRFSVPLVRRDPAGHLVDGEVDFVVVCPDFGFVVIEVKGGQVGFDSTSGKWTSKPLGAGTFQTVVRDPFVQAIDRKKDLERALKAHPDWSGADPVSAHGVLLPDTPESEAAGFVGLVASPPMLGGEDSVAGLQAWIDALKLEFWGPSPGCGLLEAQLAVIRKVIAKDVLATPLVARSLELQEDERIRLTAEQGVLLEAIANRARAVVAGGAGTGKTVLAVEWARRLSEEGEKTLLLCFNRPLADQLRAVRGRERHKYDPMTFHSLCEWRAREVKKATGTDLLAEAEMQYPTGPKSDVWLPYVLARSAALDPLRYDVIIIDEGQDFSRLHWASIKSLLRSGRNSKLYIFLDQNQRVYPRGAKGLPVRERPFLLTRNCRNTDEIHKSAYSHYQGVPTRPPPIAGAPIRKITTPRQGDQAILIRDEVARLISDEKVQPEDIAVLIASDTPARWFQAIQAAVPLPRKVKWSEKKHWQGRAVLLDSVRRFKGLESPVVILWLTRVEAATSERMYVGMTRAKSLLIIVGSDIACERALGGAP